MTTAIYAPQRLRETWIDREGYVAIWRDKDHVESVSIDWVRDLGGETISTSAWESVSGGMTLASPSSTSTTATVTPTGNPGHRSEIANTITTSGSRTLRKIVRVYGREGLVADYA